MKSFSYVIQDPVGIHARPAGVLVQEARKYQSDLQLASAGKTADLKRIFALMALGVKQGMEVTVTATGEDETQAIQALTECLKNNF